jgi:hypothetical protein
MPTDIKLDQEGGNWVVVEGGVLKTTAADFMLDSPVRRRAGGSQHRRALVHDAQDGLTINFAGDYRGGVTVIGNLVVTGDVKVGSGAALGASVESLHARVNELQNTVRSLVDLVGAVFIPPWINKTEVEQGDDMGMSTQSAEQLGLIVQFEIDQRNPNFSHEDVISITPPAGTPVLRGSTVIVKINLEG